MSRTVEPTDRDILGQSRALGDPTRLAVFTYVRDADEPVGVAELTDHFGLNHNAIRQHLAKLRDAGLVIEEHEAPSGPGRPPLRYRPTPGASERWGGVSPYQELSLMLLEVLNGDRDARDVGRSTGRRLADADRPDRDAVEVLEAVARRLGFAPRVQSTRTGTDVVLERCPFLEAAEREPDIVCELHHGIAQGIAEQRGRASEDIDLLVRKPKRAGCRIKVPVAD